MNSDETLKKWLYDNLSSVLSFPLPPDLIEYILKIENDRDIEDYCKTLLDYSNPRHVQFVENFIIIRRSGLKGYKKSPESEYGNKSSKNTKRDNTKVMENKVKESSPDSTSNSNNNETKIKKKSKFVNLYSAEGKNFDVILLKGRHSCDCQATKHRLVNNCLKCGKIVCEQEGSGPCMFCSNLVCSNEEMQVINANTKHSKKLFQNLMKVRGSDSAEAAVKQRDRLLEYDRTSERRTKVIDDEGEYFTSSSVWLSPEERERVKQKEKEMASRKHASRMNKKITFDFAGREVIDEPEFDEEFFRDVLDKVDSTSSSYIVNPMLEDDLHPIFIERKPHRSVKHNSQAEDTLQHTRVQDKEFLEMVDSGACLSMHQPWASLLVYGIKKDEGRTWYSSHRGKLWIAAGSKVPSPEEIKQIEEIYISILGEENVVFPSNYPTSCLLGCVNMIECLPQEEYRDKYPDGESESPFVFICRDPEVLNIKFPITGKHKIYKLDSKIHKAAQKSILHQARERSY